MSEAKTGKRNPSSSKSVVVLNKSFDVIKKFETRYLFERWIVKLGYSKSQGGACKKASPYFKTREIFDNKYYFMKEKDYEKLINQSKGQLEEALNEFLSTVE